MQPIDSVVGNGVRVGVTVGNAVKVMVGESEGVGEGVDVLETASVLVGWVIGVFVGTTAMGVLLVDSGSVKPTAVGDAAGG